jgi:hypothetical protein
MPSLFFITMQVWTNKNINGSADSYDYDIEIEDNRIILKYSGDEQWTEPGSKAGVLIDDGDGVVIKLKDRKPLALDYHEVIEVLTLLIANHKDKIEIKETKTIKSI